MRERVFEVRDENGHYVLFSDGSIEGFGESAAVLNGHTGIVAREVAKAREDEALKRGET